MRAVMLAAPVVAPVIVAIAPEVVVAAAAVAAVAPELVIPLVNYEIIPVTTPPVFENPFTLEEIEKRHKERLELLAASYAEDIAEAKEMFNQVRFTF